jgi:hypothetical protein
MGAGASAPAAAAPEAAAAAASGGRDRGKVYNVYAQEISPTNQMPASAAQAPSPGQRVPLSTARVSSTIPKGGAEEGTTWQYPSPPMFWNALVRKAKADGVDETDMDVVVKIHNEMNERAWRELTRWEASYAACVLLPPRLAQSAARARAHHVVGSAARSRARSPPPRSRIARRPPPFLHTAQLAPARRALAAALHGQAVRADAQGARQGGAGLRLPL